MSSRHPSLLPKSIHHRARHFFKSKDAYEAELLGLQRRILDLQRKLHRQGRKAILMLEGPDAAGKGGVIKRFTEHLDPRGLAVHSIGAPNPVEVQQHYLQRFWANLPTPGMLAIFDRSWYGRVLVERVEKLVPPATWKRAYAEINAVEKMWVDDGIFIGKYLLDLSYDEQKDRFQERESDPLTAWKLTDDDWRNRRKWNDYVPAYRDVIKRTSTRHAPWAIVPADSKWFCRVSILRDFSARLAKHLLP